MTRNLTVVPPDAKPEAKPEKAKTPITIKGAAESSERDLLVAMRTHLAAELDKGAVPPHALAGVMAKVREYDRDIRSIDARASEEGGENSGPVPDEKFDASAI